jgi:hypothetical protein
MTEIDGLQFLLCHTEDEWGFGDYGKDKYVGPCCRNLAYYQNGKLWCLDCKRPRGRLPPGAIAKLSEILKVFPGIRNETHILGDRSDPETSNDDEQAPNALERDT